MGKVVPMKKLHFFPLKPCISEGITNSCLARTAPPASSLLFLLLPEVSPFSVSRSLSLSSRRKAKETRTILRTRGKSSFRFDRFLRFQNAERDIIGSEERNRRRLFISCSARDL